MGLRKSSSIYAYFLLDLRPVKALFKHYFELINDLPIYYRGLQTLQEDPAVIYKLYSHAEVLGMVFSSIYCFQGRQKNTILLRISSYKSRMEPYPCPIHKNQFIIEDLESSNCFYVVTGPFLELLDFQKPFLV